MSETCRNKYSYIFILLFSLLCVSGSFSASAQTTDTTAADTTAVKPKKKDLARHQLTLGMDIYHPVLNQLLDDRYAYEFAGSYYMRNEYYFTAEGGWGGSKAAYNNLSYTTNNEFMRIGFNKSILARDKPNDWDMMFIGLAGGGTVVNRSAANYVITDSVWGNRVGATPARSFGAYWLELTGGVRVALVKNLFAGWNIRAKFLMNGKSFNDLSPLYIAGFGKGDKNSAFDFNAYISYGIRWKRRKGPQVDEQTGKIIVPPAPAADTTIVTPKTNKTDSSAARPVPAGK